VALVFLGICGAYFVYFSLLSFTSLCMHFLQVMKINGVISKDLNEDKYAALDAKVLRWFKQGIYFCTFAACFYTLQLLLMMSSNFASRHFRHRLYYLTLSICMSLLMIVYYTWAMQGLRLYFGEVREN
jgi:hypothetical protein